MINSIKTSSRRLAALVAIVVSALAFYPTAGSAATVTVTVGNNCFCFTPASVTIHPGDTVR
jgi:plastocyanin